LTLITKGGFGSLLKGQPPVKKRTNNFDSCRDLSGRRLRHVNQEKLLNDWQQRKVDEERMLKDYNNNEISNANNYVEKLHHKEIEAINTNFKLDNHEVTESISSSIKYLMRKKNREKSKIAKIEKLEINIYNDRKIREHNNFNFEKFKEDVSLKMNNSYSNFGMLKNHNKNIEIGKSIKLNETNKNSILQKEEENEGKEIVLNKIAKNKQEDKIKLEKNKNKDLNLNVLQNNKFDILSSLSEKSDDLNKEDLERELMDI